MNRARRTLAALAAAVVAVVIGLVQPPGAAAEPSGDAATVPPSWYLALGDSLAAGYQPGIGDDKQGGYAGHVLTALRARSPHAHLANFACSGETTLTMVSGGVCSYAKGNQLAQALSFLKAYQARTRVITVDIGANDVQRCVVGVVIDQACVQAGLADVARVLPKTLRALRQAAPKARIFVLNYYDPFLAAWLLGPDGQQLAVESVALLQVLNGIIDAAATRVGGKTADIATAFSSTDFATQVELPPFGTVPLNVARICTWTWMCTLSDIHANDTGYAVIGQTVTGLLPQTEPIP